MGVKIYSWQITGKYTTWIGNYRQKYNCGPFSEGYLFFETERFIVAIQNKIIRTVNMNKKLWKTNTWTRHDVCDIYHKCAQYEETKDLGR